jgi:Stigma-specific protein, Stig1
MNQERFDGLARGLATNRLSRWQVLKAVGAVASLGFLETLSPLRTPFAVAAACPNNNCRRDPISENNRCRTCDEMGNHYVNKGVKDSAGTYHKGHIGWTKPTWYVTDPAPSVEGPYKNASGEWCYRARYNFKASVTSKVRTIRWVPKPPPPKRCKKKCDKAIKQWCAANDAHERRHVQDNQKIVNEANAGTAKFELDSLNPNPFVGCDIDQTVAKQEVLSQAKQYRDGLIDQLNAESEKRGKDFHSTPEGGVFPDPCGPCDSCKCGPKGVTCPPDKADFCNGKCVNTQTDSNNCGKCGKKCATGQACKQGQCVMENCKPQLASCANDFECCSASGLAGHSGICCGGHCFQSCPSGCVSGEPPAGKECCRGGTGGVCCTPGGNCERCLPGGPCTPYP